MIPAIVRDDTESAAEQMLHPLLRDGLDERYTVFHSFRTITPNRNGLLLDGEIDFLIFSPEEGFLVLEAKSGAVVYDGATRRWYLNDMPIRDPVEQARTGKYKVRDFLNRRIGKQLPCTFAHAVCFPHTFAEPTTLPPDVDRSMLLTATDLQHVSARVREVFALSGPPHRALGEKETERVREALMPHCEYGVRLPDRIGLEERQFFSLTGEQCRMLEFIRNQRTALVKGCAGSGKTVMAVKKARELAEEGSRVLLLAYNQLIGQHLIAAVADVPGITAGTYHDYCIARLDAAGRLPEGPRDDDFFNRVIPQAFYELVSGSENRYDALIVDEGQDFRADYWISISCLLRDNGYFYIFYDPDQNVFNTDMDFPIDGPPFVLAENCRNTKAICGYVSSYARQPLRTMDGSPEGVAVEESILPSPAGRRRKVGAILHELVNEQGLSPDRIVILGGHRLEGTSIPPGSRVGNFTVVEGGGEGNNTVRYHTYMKFKGCEADAVILLDVDQADLRWSNQAIYTTASRAKHLLYVVRTA
jgi:hypothetical protein